MLIISGVPEWSAHYGKLYKTENDVITALKLIKPTTDKELTVYQILIKYFDYKMKSGNDG